MSEAASNPPATQVGPVPHNPPSPTTIIAESPAAPVTKHAETAARKAKEAKLTRSQLEAVINSGGTVIHNGEQITSIHALPDDADLAAGDAEKEAQARQDIHLQMDVLAARLKSLPAAPVTKSTK